jgi:hypothetical protein
MRSECIRPNLMAGRQMVSKLAEAEDERSLAAERRFYWGVILQAFAAQLQWPVNGQMVWMSDEEWKDVLTAAFERESVRLAMAFDGPGVVMLGQRTSKFGKGKFSDWLEFLHAAAASRGVVVYPEEKAA